MKKSIVRSILLLLVFSLNASYSFAVTKAKAKIVNQGNAKTIYQFDSGNAFEKAVITNHPDIHCSLVDLTKTMAQPTKRMFTSFYKSIIPVTITIENNTPNCNIHLNTHAALANGLTVTTDLALKKLKNRFFVHKVVQYILTVGNIAGALIPTGLLTYFVGLPAGKMLASKVPSIINAISDMPGAVYIAPAVAAAGVYASLKYVVPYLYKATGTEELTNETIRYIKRIMSACDAQKITHDIERKLAAEHVTIQPGQRFSTTIFIKKENMFAIQQGYTLPMLDYVIMQQNY